MDYTFSSNNSDNCNFQCKYEYICYPWKFSAWTF